MATNRVKLEDVINEAKTALETSNPDRAIALCRHVFNYYPRCLEATRVLGEAYTEKRLLDEADQLFVFVLSADPQDVLGYVDRGFIAYERSSVDEAIMYYERALELDPSIEQLREELLRLYREQYGMGRRAKIRLTKVGLANARMRDGFYGQAIEEFAGVLNETPNRLDVQVGLMEAYWRNRDYPRAERLANELLQNHSNLVKANLILWHIYGVRRNQDRAATYLDKAHALDPLNLLAERLFEDGLVSNDAMRYISMLGVPALPAADEATLSQSFSKAEVLVPEWVYTPVDTDLVLGLRPEVPSPLADTPSNLGIDVFALLADTEKHVSGKRFEETPREKEPEPTEAVITQKALDELDQLRSSAADEQSDNLFNLFEEVEIVPRSDLSKTSEPSTTGGSIPPAGAFDLELGSDEVDDLSFFNEIEAPGFLEYEDEADQPANLASKPLAKPFSLDDLEPESEPSAELFSFDELESPPVTRPFSLSLPEENSADVSAVDPFGFDPESLPVVEEPGVFPVEEAKAEIPDFFGEENFPWQMPGEEAPAPFSIVEEKLSADAEEEAWTSAVPWLEPEKMVDGPDVVADELLPDEPAAEVIASPETEFSLDNLQPLLPDENAEEAVAVPTLETAVNRMPHAFHQRDERGPLPAFALTVSPAIPQPTDTTARSADSSVSFDYLAEAGLVEEEMAVAAAEPATDLTTDVLPQLPQPNQEQENDTMPIKRGPEDENSVFDWEREELPDYLQAFAMDEDEVARSGLAAPNPTITDVNTPPARIRPKDDTGAPGDLPEWLNPAIGGTGPGGRAVRGDQVDLGSVARPGVVVLYPTGLMRLTWMHQGLPALCPVFRVWITLTWVVCSLLAWEMIILVVRVRPLCRT